MKKWGKIRSVILWFCWFLLFIILIGLIPGTTYIDHETGNSVMYNIPSFLCLIGPIAITYITVKRHNEGKPIFKYKNQKYTSTSEDDLRKNTIQNQKVFDEKEEQDIIKIPLSRKKREELARNLLVDAKFNADMANKDTSVREFLRHYNEAILCLSKLQQLEGKVKLSGESPTYSVRRLNEEIQWHLCDAIERAKDSAISEIKGKYRNSIEYQNKRANSFFMDIEECENKFSQGTKDFAKKAIEQVAHAAGVSAPTKDFGGNDIYKKDLGIKSIDTMEGHDFEYWCADLLKQNGFINVEVTPGSGDQGVDVLAEKDGVRYAVQCKCYAHDLGNTPIQEVESGRIYYGCHVGAVMTNRYFTQGAKELAQKTGTLLWDRDSIEKMLTK